MTPSRNRVGLAIRVRRIALEWTQQQLALRAGLSQPRLSEFERGAFRHKQQPHELPAIAAALGVTVAALLQRTPGAPSPSTRHREMST